MNESTDSAKPSSVLKSEHRVIERVLSVLRTLVTRSERGEGFETASLRRCVQFFRLFADAYHHAKEEGLLFPALESRGIPREGGPIGVMLFEHTQARQFTRNMGEALDAAEAGVSDAEARFRAAAQDYLELLTEHINKEDGCLFVMGDEALTDQDQSALCSQFCEVSCQAFEGKHREELEAIADELEKRWIQ